MQRSSSGSASYLQLRANKNLSIHTPSQSHQSSTTYSARDHAGSLLPTPSIAKGDSLQRSSSTNHNTNNHSSSNSSSNNNSNNSFTSKHPTRQGQSSQNQIGSMSSRPTSEYYNNKASELYHLLNRDVNVSAIALNASSNSNSNNNPHSYNNNIPLSNQNTNSINTSCYSSAYTNDNKENIHMNSNNNNNTNNYNNSSKAHTQQQSQQQLETLRSRQNNRTPIAKSKSPMALSNRSITPVSPTPPNNGKINGSNGSQHCSRGVYESMVFSSSNISNKLKHSYSPNSFLNAKQQTGSSSSSSASSTSKTVNLAGKKSRQEQYQQSQSSISQQQLQDSQDQNTSINISQLLNLNTIFTNPSVYGQQLQPQSIHSHPQQQSQSMLRQTQSQRTSIEGSVYSSASSSNHNSNNNYNNNNNNYSSCNNNNNINNNQQSQSSSSASSTMLENCVIIQKQNEISGLRKDLRTAIAESTAIKNRLKVSENECKTLRAQAETERRYRPLVDEYVGKIKGLQFLLAHEKRVSAKVIQETLLRNQNMSLILENLANIISIIQQKIDALASPPEKILQSIRDSLNPILLCLVPVIEDIQQHSTVIQGQMGSNAAPTQDGGKQSQSHAGVDAKNHPKPKRVSSHSSKDSALPLSNNVPSNNSNIRKKKLAEHAEQRTSTTQLQKSSQQLQQQTQLQNQKRPLTSRGSMQSSNSSNNLVRSNHAASVDYLNESPEYSSRPTRSVSSMASTPIPPALPQPKSNQPLQHSQQPQSQQQQTVHNNHHLNSLQSQQQQIQQQQQQQLQQQQQQQQLQQQQHQMNHQSSSEIMISDSFYQQCLTNNSLRISESSYQSSTMKFPQHQQMLQQNVYLHPNAQPLGGAFLKASPNRASTSNGLFEFSHSPSDSISRSAAIVAGMASVAAGSSMNHLQSSSAAGGSNSLGGGGLIPTAAQYSMLGSFAKSKQSLIDEDCLENLLEGVDITTTDETANLHNNPFNESQKIFNNTLKGLSETLKNLRYEDQLDSSSIYNQHHSHTHSQQKNAIPSYVNSPFKPQQPSSNQPMQSQPQPSSISKQQNQQTHSQVESQKALISSAGSVEAALLGNISQENHSIHGMPAAVDSISTNKEIEIIKNRILQRQSRRKLNSASVSPCNRNSSAVTAGFGGSNGTNAAEFSSEHSNSSRNTTSDNHHNQSHHFM